MSRHFDRVIIVDWSARGTPSPKRPSADAIWIGVAGEHASSPRYFRTRADAMNWLADTLANAIGAGERALVGFDFPFGYPAGFAKAVTGSPDALALWSYLAERITDGPGNANNRFAVAAALNARLPGTGPFWGRPTGLVLPDLPERGRERHGHGFAERRLVEERVRGAQPVWKLYTTGSVGSQVLTGLPALVALRADPRLDGQTAIWPFEGGLARPDAPVVLAEIYPSLLRPEIPADAIKDAVQVETTARTLAALDADGTLPALFAGATDLTSAERLRITREEAWMLGAGFEVRLRAAARRPERVRNDCYAMPAGVNWVPVDTALVRLRDNIAPVAATETLPVADAGGRILAAPLLARRSHPPAPNSAVDGYGFAHASLGPGDPALRLLAGRAAAGVPFAGTVPDGACLRILTGALLPDGVDTVVLDEDTTRDGDMIRFRRGLRPGANTRPAGEDVVEGAEILPGGHRLAPQDLGLAAAAGVARVPVRRALRVAVLSTGDEVVAPDVDAAPYQTYDANRPMLIETLRRWNIITIDLGQSADNPEAVRAALDRGAAEADAIMTSGGASAGDEDHVAALLRDQGAIWTWRIAVKPGRPLATGLWADTPVFALPGNPVAAFVCTLIFVRPALGQLAGAPWQQHSGILLPAAFEKSKRPGRREYLRARLNDEGAVEVFPSEGSGRVSGLSWARGLVELDDGPREIRAGDPVRYLAFAEFGL